MTTQHSDDDLMRAHVRGDATAFAELFDRWRPRLSGMFWRAGLGREDARDLVQQAFLHLHRARRDYRPGSELRAWIYTIALNLQREHFRRRSRKPEGPLDEADAPAEHASAEASVEAGELRDAVARLPDAQREVIVLHWFEGLTFREIGDVVGATEGAVKVRAHRGYESLRVHLDASRREPRVTGAAVVEYEGGES